MSVRQNFFTIARRTKRPPKTHATSLVQLLASYSKKLTDGTLPALVKAKQSNYKTTASQNKIRYESASQNDIKNVRLLNQREQGNQPQKHFHRIP